MRISVGIVVVLFLLLILEITNVKGYIELGMIFLGLIISFSLLRQLKFREARK